MLGNINDLKPKKEEKPAEETVVQQKAEETPKEVEQTVVETEPVAVETEKQEEVAQNEIKQEETPKIEEVAQEETPVNPEPETKETEVQEEKAEEPKPEPVVNTDTKTEEKVEEEKAEDNSGVYRTEIPTAGVKQVGFIDLSNINSKTRPDKKSKAEKRKEREEKERLRKEAQQASRMAREGEAGKKKKRNRIGKERVDVEAEAAQQTTDPRKANKNQNQQQNQQQAQASGKKNKKKKKNAKVQELTDEEIAKQVKETLARLTTKQVKKGVKYRKDKREAIHNRVLKLTEYVTANELATMMDVPVTQVIGTCMQIGIMVSINQRLDAETINLVAEEFGYTTTYVSEDVSHAIEEEADKEEDLVPRAPIITVMGHVDHGKTSLLDYIRKTNVIAGEAGGITQHIGAYNVKMANGKRITFLDTPGHEAFTAMRARGAKVTDIAIIIIAADDDIMPQTKEAISHAVAANVPMVFAINKIDKPGANPEKIKEQLAAMNYLVEDWGGKYQSQDISAKKGINVDLLMEKVLLEAEMLDLKANPNRKATGSVIESSLDSIKET